MADLNEKTSDEDIPDAPPKEPISTPRSSGEQAGPSTMAALGSLLSVSLSIVLLFILKTIFEEGVAMLYVWFNLGLSSVIQGWFHTPLGGALLSSESCDQMASRIEIPGLDVKIASYITRGTHLLQSELSDELDLPIASDRSRKTRFQKRSQESEWFQADSNFCRIGMQYHTSSESSVSMELWLPDDWSGRFLSLGNAGLAGHIQYGQLAAGVAMGFATVSADSGHKGGSGRPFLNHPEVTRDFVWRSVHSGAVIGKAVTRLYYQREHSKSYYMGCSTGGRQAMKSAQMWPGDFDGIVAGAPAIDFNNLVGFVGALHVRMGTDTSAHDFVTKQKWASISRHILNQCDGLDGAVDGIIEDTSLCVPDLSLLKCGTIGVSAEDCLTYGQIHRASMLFCPLLKPPEWDLISPRFNPGIAFEKYPVYYNGKLDPLALDWFRYVVYSDPEWEPTNFNIGDVLLNDDLDMFGVSSFNPDLTAFRDAGGRLLMYHGMQDQIISSENSARYYEMVSKKMQLGPSQLDEFFRYFRISGMEHCGGGPGAWNFGNVNRFDHAASRGAENHALLAVVKWVEEGIAPEYLRGTKYVDDDQSKGVAFARRHCRYPMRNVYTGPGPHTKEENWRCIFDGTPKINTCW